MQNMFSDHNGDKLKISKRYMENSLNIWKTNITLINNLWLQSKSQGKLESILKGEMKI